MTLFEKIRDFVDTIEEKDFNKYLLIFLSSILLIIGFIVFRHYRTINQLKKRINIINEMREEDVKRILDKAERVQKQRDEADALLAQDEDFKIKGYFKSVLDKLGLSDKKTVETPSQIDREDKYRESILNVKFTDMDMKQLSELLNEIEQKRRIYTKELEITKSKKKPDKIEVNLTIATLLIKS